MAGREPVAAPDRRVAEQPRRQKRRRIALLLPQQCYQRQYAEGQQPERHGQGFRIHALHLLERQDDGADEQDEQHQARRIEGGAAPVAGARVKPQHQKEGDQPERQVDEEDRLPAERLGEIAAGHRAKRAGRDRNAGEITLIFAALARRDGLADQRLRQRHQAAAAETLQHAGGGEEFDIGRERAEHRAEHEDRERKDHHPAPAERVAEPAVDRGRDGIGDQVRHHHPGRALDLA